VKEESFGGENPRMEGINRDKGETLSFEEK
jgi:hypothetical protein